MRNLFNNLKIVSSYVLVMAFFAVVSPLAVSAQTFSSSATIQILDRVKGSATPRPANPYPSTINVSGLPTTGSYRIQVKLKGFTHSFPDDVGALLVAPNGESVRLFTDCMGEGGGGGITVPIDLTFDDFAAQPLPDNPTSSTPSGIYQPKEGTKFGDDPLHDINFPSPAPNAPYAITLGTLGNVSRNGFWKLFVDDDGPQDDGEIANGWEITFIPAPTSAPAVISGNVQILGSGVVNAKLTLTDTNGLQTVIYTDMNGYYEFPAAATGQTYTLSVSAKGHTFTPATQTITLNENTTVNWSGT